MMKVSYERNMEHAYVKVEVADYVRTFEEDMLKNPIAGVLPVQKECRDGSVVFAYDITNKQSFTEYCKQNEFQVDLICKVVERIICNLKAAKEFLLMSDNFMLSHEYIYVGDEGETIWLCYVMGYHHSIQTQFTELFEEWMKLIDYADKATVQLVYELYQKSRQTMCTYDQLLEVIHRVSRQPVKRQQEGKIEDEISDEKIQRMFQDKVTEELRFEDLSEEPLVDEKEVLFYPRVCYVKAIGIVVIEILLLILLFRAGILNDTYHRVDALKVLCVIVVLLVAGGILIRNLFQKKHRLSRMIRNVHNPRTDSIPMQQQVCMQQKRNPTYDNHRVRTTADQEEPFIRQETFEDQATQLLYEEQETQLLFHSNRLSLIPQTQACEEIFFEGEEAVVGSSKEQAKIILAYPTVSRSHARILRIGSEFYVEDLSSTNGTFLNHKRLESGKRERLEHQGILQFAEYAYEISICDLT